MLIRIEAEGRDKMGEWFTATYICLGCGRKSGGDNLLRYAPQIGSIQYVPCECGEKQSRVVRLEWFTSPAAYVKNRGG